MKYTLSENGQITLRDYYTLSLLFIFFNMYSSSCTGGPGRIKVYKKPNLKCIKVPLSIYKGPDCTYSQFLFYWITKNQIDHLVKRRSIKGVIFFSLSCRKSKEWWLIYGLTSVKGLSLVPCNSISEQVTRTSQCLFSDTLLTHILIRHPKATCTFVLGQPFVSRII